MTSTPPVPDRAITAAADAIHAQVCSVWRSHDAARDLADARAAVEAAAPAIREAERQRWLAVLADHYLANVICDPDRKLDNPVCGCSLVFLGWHPSIGQARQAWLDHVAGVAERHGK